LRPVTGLHVLALRIRTLKIPALKVLALVRPTRDARSRVRWRWTARLGAWSRTRLRAVVALVVGPLIGPIQTTGRRVRAIGIGRAAVAIGGLLQRRWPVVARSLLRTWTAVPIRGGPIRLPILALGLTFLTVRPRVRGALLTTVRLLFLTVLPLLQTVRSCVPRPLLLTVLLALLTVLPLLLAFRTSILPLLGRRTRGCRFRPALSRTLPLRGFCLTRGLGLGSLPRRRGCPLRTRLRPLASRRRAGAFLRRAFRAGATARRLSAPGPMVFRTALRQQDSARRRVGRLEGGQNRQYGAGQKEQSQEPHRGLVSGQAEPNTERCDWFPADAR
jgi:hypothetical protein